MMEEKKKRVEEWTETEGQGGGRNKKMMIRMMRGQSGRSSGNRQDQLRDNAPVDVTKTGVSG
jgi:hypothetical protein